MKIHACLLKNLKSSSQRDPKITPWIPGGDTALFGGLSGVHKQARNPRGARWVCLQTWGFYYHEIFVGRTLFLKVLVSQGYSVASGVLLCLMNRSPSCPHTVYVPWKGGMSTSGVSARFQPAPPIHLPTLVCLQAPRGSSYQFGLEEQGHPEVALAMAVEVQEIDGAKDPQVHRGHPDPCRFQEAHVQ